MAASRAIGSTITLITNSQIRYEGTLGHIDAHKNTVSLTNVRVFGTEGRAKAKGQVEVPVAEQVYDQIVFRGSDIEELTVFEESHNAMMDPAIVTALPAKNNTANTSNNNSNDVNHNNNHCISNKSATASVGNPQTCSASAGLASHQKQQQHMYSGGYRRGGYRSGRRLDMHTGRDFHPATGTAKEAFEDDFDFIKSREEFEKKRSEFEKAKEEAKNHSKAYDRNSFFDKISCDQQDRMAHPDREGMKRTDAETFGSELVGNMRGLRRGRGGRGRYNSRYN